MGNPTVSCLRPQVRVKCAIWDSAEVLRITKAIGRWDLFSGLELNSAGLSRTDLAYRWSRKLIFMIIPIAFFNGSIIRSGFLHIVLIWHEVWPSNITWLSLKCLCCDYLCHIVCCQSMWWRFLFLSFPFISILPLLSLLIRPSNPQSLLFTAERRRRRRRKRMRSFRKQSSLYRRPKGILVE